LSGTQIPPDASPSTEDVLASIRRVLSKMKAPAGIGSEALEMPQHQQAAEQNVLVPESSAMSDDSSTEPRRTGAEGDAAQGLRVEDAQRLWLWEQAALQAQLARLEHKIDVLGAIVTAAAAIGVSTGLGVLAGFFLGLEVGAGVYGVSCIVTVVALRFAFTRNPSGHRKQ
jgi:hypothetical protein